MVINVGEVFCSHSGKFETMTSAPRSTQTKLGARKRSWKHEDGQRDNVTQLVSTGLKKTWVLAPISNGMKRVLETFSIGDQCRPIFYFREIHVFSYIDNCRTEC